jgi:tRNA A37 N6-isopentenylltransferase MiaA
MVVNMSNTITTLNQLFKEAYFIGQLSEKEQVKYRLISRYENKVSQRLRDEAKALMKKGGDEFQRTMTLLMLSPNNIFAKISKNDTWQMGTIPIPFKVD